MFVQSTLFDDRTPDLPGNIKIHWQGVGQDAGYTVVNGQVGDDSGWFVVNSLGGTLTAETTINGTQDTLTLGPQFNYPKVWWENGSWMAYPNSLVTPTSWTLVRSHLTHWYPREWQFQWLETQGADDINDVKMHWYGDTWFDGNGVGRGSLHDNPDDEEEEEEGEGEGEGEEEEEETPATATYTYTWEGYKHSGKGTAPAGEYRIEGSDTKMNVGFWDDEDNEYKLELGENYEMAPVRMMQLGLLRVPTMNGNAPTSWSFLGASWDDPDPFDWRYWHCIRCALIERESVTEAVLDGTRDLGSLVGGEDALWQMSPLTPPNLDCIRVMRELIVQLSQEYIDLEKVKEVVQDEDGTGLPRKQNCHLSIAEYEHLAGGWERGDPVSLMSAGSLKGFLKDARDVLRKMTITTSPWTVFNAYKTGWMGGAGWSYEDDGEDFDDAWQEAIDDYEELGKDDHWVYWTRSRGEHIPNGWTSSIGGRSGVQQRTGHPASWEVQFGLWQTAVFDIPHPPTSVLDGEVMATPKALYVKNSLAPQYEIDDPLYGGVVRKVEYYSSVTEEGFEVGLADFPLVWEEEMPSSPIQPPPVTEDGFKEWTVWGNETSWWIYVSWAQSFRFDGIDIDPGDGGDEEEEGGGEGGGDTPPEPSALPSPKLDWYIEDGTENTVELKGPGPYRFPARLGSYRRVTSREGEGETKVVPDPNLRYHYPVMFYTRQKTVENGKRAWWIYSRYEVPKLELNEDGLAEWVFQERPKVATIRSNPNGYTTSTIPMPTESGDERILRQSREEAKADAIARLRKQAKEVVNTSRRENLRCRQQ